MRTLLPLLLLPAVLAAQPYPGDVLCVGSDGVLYRLGREQSAVATLQLTAGPLVGPIVDVDNRTVLVADPGGGNILRVDPVTLTVLGTVARGVGAPVGLYLDPDGNLLVADARSQALLRVDRTGAVSTFWSASGRLRDPRGGMTLDVDTSDLVVQEASPALSAPLYRIRLDAQSVVTLAQGLRPGFQVVKHIPSGDFFVASADTGNVAIYRVQDGAATATSWLPATGQLQAVASLATDRSSAVTQQLLVGAYAVSPASRGLYAVDVATKQVVRLADLPTTVTGVAFAGSRNLATVRKARGLWEVRVSFPEHPAHQYFILPSLHGVRPGQPLPDGRTAWLVPDGVTAHIVFRGDIFPATRNFRGLLDARGRSTGLLDLRGMLPWGRGFVVWLLAVAVERKAPWHIVAVSDPIAVQLL